MSTRSGPPSPSASSPKGTSDRKYPLPLTPPRPRKSGRGALSSGRLLALRPPALDLDLDNLDGVEELICREDFLSPGVGSALSAGTVRPVSCPVHKLRFSEVFFTGQKATGTPVAPHKGMSFSQKQKKLQELMNQPGAEEELASTLKRFFPPWEEGSGLSPEGRVLVDSLLGRHPENEVLREALKVLSPEIQVSSSFFRHPRLTSFLIAINPSALAGLFEGQHQTPVDELISRMSKLSLELVSPKNALDMASLIAGMSYPSRHACIDLLAGILQKQSPPSIDLLDTTVKVLRTEIQEQTISQEHFSCLIGTFTTHKHWSGIAELFYCLRSNLFDGGKHDKWLQLILESSSPGELEGMEQAAPAIISHATQFGQPLNEPLVLEYWSKVEDDPKSRCALLTALLRYSIEFRVALPSVAKVFQMLIVDEEASAAMQDNARVEALTSLFSYQSTLQKLEVKDPKDLTKALQWAQVTAGSKECMKSLIFAIASFAANSEELVSSEWIEEVLSIGTSWQGETLFNQDDWESVLHAIGISRFDEEQLYQILLQADLSDAFTVTLIQEFFARDFHFDVKQAQSLYDKLCLPVNDYEFSASSFLAHLFEKQKGLCQVLLDTFWTTSLEAERLTGCRSLLVFSAEHNMEVPAVYLNSLKERLLALGDYSLARKVFGTLVECERNILTEEEVQAYTLTLIQKIPELIEEEGQDLEIEQLSFLAQEVTRSFLTEEASAASLLRALPATVSHSSYDQCLNGLWSEIEPSSLFIDAEMVRKHLDEARDAQLFLTIGGIFECGAKQPAAIIPIEQIKLTLQKALTPVDGEELYPEHRFYAVRMCLRYMKIKGISLPPDLELDVYARCMETRYGFIAAVEYVAHEASLDVSAIEDNFEQGALSEEAASEQTQSVTQTACDKVTDILKKAASSTPPNDHAMEAAASFIMELDLQGKVLASLLASKCLLPASKLAGKMIAVDAEEGGQVFVSEADLIQALIYLKDCPKESTDFKKVFQTLLCFAERQEILLGNDATAYEALVSIIQAIPEVYDKPTAALFSFVGRQLQARELTDEQQKQILVAFCKKNMASILSAPYVNATFDSFFPDGLRAQVAADAICALIEEGTPRWQRAAFSLMERVGAQELLPLLQSKDSSPSLADWLSIVEPLQAHQVVLSYQGVKFPPAPLSSIRRISSLYHSFMGGVRRSGDIKLLYYVDKVCNKEPLLGLVNAQDKPAEFAQQNADIVNQLELVAYELDIMKRAYDQEQDESLHAHLRDEIEFVFNTLENASRQCGARFTDILPDTLHYLHTKRVSLLGDTYKAPYDHVWNERPEGEGKNKRFFYDLAYRQAFEAVDLSFRLLKGELERAYNESLTEEDFLAGHSYETMEVHDYRSLFLAMQEQTEGKLRLDHKPNGSSIDGGGDGVVESASTIDWQEEEVRKRRIESPLMATRSLALFADIYEAVRQEPYGDGLARSFVESQRAAGASIGEAYFTDDQGNVQLRSSCVFEALKQAGVLEPIA